MLTANKKAEVEYEKVASQEVDERMEVLEKYASWADQTLAAEYGENNYTVEDVEKLAAIADTSVPAGPIIASNESTFAV